MKVNMMAMKWKTELMMDLTMVIKLKGQELMEKTTELGWKERLMMDYMMAEQLKDN